MYLYCKACNGNGFVNSWFGNIKECKYCKGKGRFYMMQKPCSFCKVAYTRLHKELREEQEKRLCCYCLNHGFVLETAENDPIEAKIYQLQSQVDKLICEMFVKREN